MNRVPSVMIRIVNIVYRQTIHAVYDHLLLDALKNVVKDAVPMYLGCDLFDSRSYRKSLSTLCTTYLLSFSVDPAGMRNVSWWSAIDVFLALENYHPRAGEDL